MVNHVKVNESDIRHDAKWSMPVILKVADIIRERGVRGRLFDPMAGVGSKVDEVFTNFVPGCSWSGMDIEPEFAAARDWIHQGDALDPAEYPDNLRTVFTSATYANRMAGSYVGKKCDECDGEGCGACDSIGRDRSRRQGYAPSLGRAPSPGSSALHGWGPAYRAFHYQWLMVLAEVLEPGTERLILNMADHYATEVTGGPKVRRYVCEWWIGAAQSVGFRWAEGHHVDTPKSREGENGESRTAGEMVMVFDLEKVEDE